MANLFPQGYADGPAFCNRTSQRSDLIELVKASRHGWIQGRRRIGKSSLLRQTVLDIEKKYSQNIYAIHTELLSAYDQKVAARLILQAVAEITERILGHSEKALKNILGTFSALKPELTITPSGPKLKLGIDKEQSSVKDALIALDQVAQNKKVNVALFFDEFQQLGEIEHGISIEAEIRGALQISKRLSFIFSGSIRHLLEQQFSDDSRPLYKQCQRIEIKRISRSDYVQHLSNVAQLHWGAVIERNIIEEIVNLTDRHPYYVNALCGLLWLRSESPSFNDVVNTWQKEIVNSDFAAYQRILSKLSKNQNIVLSNLAISPTNQPLSSQFAQQCELSSSSIKQSIAKLTLQDLVYKDTDGFVRLFDPAVQAYLVGSLSF